jgi:murein DD-endopeptidase MepM/ murein hydrolase activator NlpD
MGRSNGISTFLLVLVVVGGFVGVLWLNSQPAAPISGALPTQAAPTEEGDSIAQLMSRSFGENSTPLPTIAIPTMQPTQPRLVLDDGATSTPISAAAVRNPEEDEVSRAVTGVTPTLPPPTAQVTVQAVTREPQQWNPPALEPPISRDPLGRDHFWFRRPIESNANNAVLFYYPYGSDGPEDVWRIHHGIDMPNDIGEEVRAAGSGEVIFAADGRLDDAGIFQNSGNYGNVVSIRHDFSYQGQTLYTVYAHLSAALVSEGDIVQAGQVIGLVGNSGLVSGPHIHFEVRVNENRYGATYNPILWMVPYVGHGIIAGRVMDASGNYLDDVSITIRNRATGLQHTTTTSYVFQDSVNDVNSDPAWQENFAVPDVPEGRYDVIVTIDGQRVVRQVQVTEGATSFVVLAPPEPPTPEADDNGASDEDGG